MNFSKWKSQQHWFWMLQLGKYWELYFTLYMYTLIPWLRGEQSNCCPPVKGEDLGNYCPRPKAEDNCFPGLVP